MAEQKVCPACNHQHSADGTCSCGCTKGAK